MSKSINDIKNELTNADKETRESLIEVYKSDTRKGVAKLIEKYEKQKIALEKEYKRLELMHQFENKYSDYEFIAGIDEAGRGPLAGPVVAASVILPKDCEILYLNDSKQVSAKKRDELFDEIKEKAVAYGIGVSSPGRIDEINVFCRQHTKQCVQPSNRCLRLNRLTYCWLMLFTFRKFRQNRLES